MSAAERVTTRMLIIDDNVFFREGIAEICEREPDLRVVGRAAGGLEAIRLVRQSCPEVVLLSISEAGCQVAEDLVAQIAGAPSRPRLVILATRDNARMARRLLTMGAWAYISKQSTREELLAVVRSVSQGSDRAVLSMPTSLLKQLTTPLARPLSDRELEVIELVATGLSNAQIAARLYISEGTVKRHLTNAYVKLDVRSRMTAINKAAAIGLLDRAA
jgi:DNA-binding NarL/FixJ family response regulator